MLVGELLLALRPRTRYFAIPFGCGIAAGVAAALFQTILRAARD